MHEYYSHFMLPLGQIIGYHCYADDTQIDICTQPDVTSALSTLSALLEIQTWMKQNFLMLNGSKTEVLFVGTLTT